MASFSVSVDVDCLFFLFFRFVVSDVDFDDWFCVRGRLFDSPGRLLAVVGSVFCLLARLF